MTDTLHDVMEDFGIHADYRAYDHLRQVLPMVAVGASFTKACSYVARSQGITLDGVVKSIAEAVHRGYFKHTDYYGTVFGCSYEPGASSFCKIVARRVYDV